MAFNAAKKQRAVKKETASRPSKSVRLGVIYQTAARIIHAEGFEAASLNDIAKAAGLTKAGLYHYISSKETLLYAIMNYGMDLVETDVIGPASKIIEPRERLRTLVRAYANLVMNERQAITIVINEANGLSAKHRASIRKRRHVFQDFVHDTIERIKTECAAPIADVGVTTLCFVGCLVWLAYWYQTDGRLTKEEVINEIETLLVDRMVGLGLAFPSSGS